jgi:hypothetical protein
MATVTVTKNLTDLWTAESASSPAWTTLSPATYTGFQREGTYCLGDKCSATTITGYITITSADLSGSRIYIWMRCNGEVDTQANGGFGIVVGDGTNRRAYYVGGNDAMGFQVGAWQCLMLDCDNPPTGYNAEQGSSAPDFTQVTQVGVRFKTLTATLGNNDNVFWDIARYGTGISVTGGTSGDYADLSLIEADDASTASGKAYGIIREIDTGVYGVQGDIIFGTATTYFACDDDEIIVEDHVHGSGTPLKHDLFSKSSGIALSNFTCGTVVGSGDSESGRNGLTIRNANYTNIVDFDTTGWKAGDLYGSTLIGVNGTIDLAWSAAVYPAHVAGCSFINCSRVEGSVSSNYETVWRNCSFIGTAAVPTGGKGDSAFLWNDADVDMKTCSFIANTDASENPHGIEFSIAGEFDLDDIIFSGNDYDIEFIERFDEREHGRRRGQHHDQHGGYDQGDGFDRGRAGVDARGPRWNRVDERSGGYDWRGVGDLCVHVGPGRDRARSRQRHDRLGKTMGRWQLLRRVGSGAE